MKRFGNPVMAALSLAIGLVMIAGAATASGMGGYVQLATGYNKISPYVF